MITDLNFLNIVPTMNTLHKAPKDLEVQQKQLIYIDRNVIIINSIVEILTVLALHAIIGQRRYSTLPQPTF